jgi:hypothetical protein
MQETTQYVRSTYIACVRWYLYLHWLASTTLHYHGLYGCLSLFSFYNYLKKHKKIEIIISKFSRVILIIVFIQHNSNKKKDQLEKETK